MIDAILQARESNCHKENPNRSPGFAPSFPCRTQPHVQQVCTISALCWGGPAQRGVSTSKSVRCCWTWAETWGQVLLWHEGGDDGAGGGPATAVGFDG